jgi:hypothetical protein
MKSACQMNDLDWTDTVPKMVAMWSDRASVMLGVQNGVAALFKEANPSIVPVHCLGHRYMSLSNSYFTSLFNLYYNII